MSEKFENLQQNQDQQIRLQNFNDIENDDCSKSFDKLSIHTQQYTTDLPTSGRYYSYDEWSSGHTSYYYANARIQNDLNVVRDCLGQRMQMEEQTIDLIMEVERMVQLMLNEYSRLHDDNQYLNDELQSCSNLVHANLDATATLRSEHEALLEENEMLKEENQKLHDNSRTDFEQIQQQLAEMDEKIKELLAKIDRLSIPQARNLSKEFIASDKSTNKTITNRSNESNTSDALSDKIKLEKINADIEAIFNEKQNQLLEQQAKIHELTTKLESQQEFAVLTDEREKLTKFNNDLTKSISVCRLELCKYNSDRIRHACKNSLV